MDRCRRIKSEKTNRKRMERGRGGEVCFRKEREESVARESVQGKGKIEDWKEEGDEEI